MANKIGPLIKEARTNAGLTQEQLAKKLPDCTASDISKAERGEKELSQAVLKQIAKLTGVTQTSLLTAAKASTYKTAKTASKTEKPAKSDKPAAKKTASKEEFKLTAAEKKLVELYRAADSDTKNAAVKLLKGEKADAGDLLGSLLGNAMELLNKK